jgi:hypothetical protein
MSVPDSLPPPEAPRRVSAGAVLLGLVGIVLLLPGLCAAAFAVGMIPALWSDPSAMIPLGMLWAVCFLISYGGIRLLRRSTRRRSGP